MDNLRDLVSGAACDDGTNRYRNPLGRFVDHMYRDTSQREQRDWVEQRDMEGMPIAHEERMLTQTRDTQAQVDEFLSGFGSSRPNGHHDMMMRHHMNDPLDSMHREIGAFQDFLQQDNGGLDAEAFGKLSIADELPTDLLNTYIKSFIHSAQSQQPFRPMQLPDLGFSDVDKAKISSRTSVLARHMFPHQSEGFIESQLNSFLSSFGATQRPVPSSRNHLDMVNEFQTFSGRDHVITDEEMEKYYQQEVHADRMAREFEQHRTNEEFEQVYQEANDTERLVEEFEGNRPIERIKNLKEITKSITEIDDPKLQSSNFMKFMSQISKGEVEFLDNQVVQRTPEEIAADKWADEFADEQGFIDPVKWAEEFKKDSMFNDGWLNEYEKFADSEELEWMKEYNDWHSSLSNTKYEFTTDAQSNPYIDHPNPFEKGVELFNEGSVSDAVLAFEAELHKNPENSACWQYLGQAHAENDKDGKAIAALLKAVQTGQNNKSALMALAVSYTNDLYKDQALDTLKTWMEGHPDYSSIKIQMPIFGEGYSFELYHAAITNMFIEAARLKPNNPDPDVQTALGLLYNLSLEYPKAVDCFQSALNVRPDDYLLWNKLGATLANSNRSDEALGCYFQALKIKPSYVRARANLGISFMALRDYEKAAQYFLQALSMHPEAKHIWTNLQMVFMSMGREDLVEKCMESNIELFKSEFDF